jgi:hypothetical protein
VPCGVEIRLAALTQFSRTDRARRAWQSPSARTARGLPSKSPADAPTMARRLGLSRHDIPSALIIDGRSTTQTGHRALRKPDIQHIGSAAAEGLLLKQGVGYQLGLAILAEGILPPLVIVTSLPLA